MTTQSRKVLGKNPRRFVTKGAFGSASTPERGEGMIERVNTAFNEKLGKMRKKQQDKIIPKEKNADIQP